MSRLPNNRYSAANDGYPSSLPGDGMDGDFEFSMDDIPPPPSPSPPINNKHSLSNIRKMSSEGRALFREGIEQTSEEPPSSQLLQRKSSSGGKKNAVPPPPPPQSSKPVLSGARPASSAGGARPVITAARPVAKHAMPMALAKAAITTASPVAKQAMPMASAKVVITAPRPVSTKQPPIAIASPIVIASPVAAAAAPPSASTTPPPKQESPPLPAHQRLDSEAKAKIGLDRKDRFAAEMRRKQLLQEQSLGGVGAAVNKPAAVAAAVSTPPFLSTSTRGTSARSSAKWSVASDDDSANEATTEDDEDESGQPGGGAAHILGMSLLARLEAATSEVPLEKLQKRLHNPIDLSQIVPEPDKTFSGLPYIDAQVWRAESAQAPSAAAMIRNSLTSSRRSIAKAFQAFDLEGSESNSLDKGHSSSSRTIEKRLSLKFDLEKDVQTSTSLAKQGIGSDYTMFNRDWSVLLRAKKISSTKVNIQVHKNKHADLALYVQLSDVPVATLKSAARASRCLHLERNTDGGVVYTLAKDKVAESHRVFWIAEGRKQQVDPGDCRFVLVVHENRAVIKARNDLIVPHLVSARGSLGNIGNPPKFNQTVMDFLDDGKKSYFRVASGMDLVLAFTCLCLSDRFAKYRCLRPNEQVRFESLHGRFETGIDPEMDVFRKTGGGGGTGSSISVNGSASNASSMMY